MLSLFLSFIINIPILKEIFHIYICLGFFSEYEKKIRKKNSRETPIIKCFHKTLFAK